MKNVRMMMCMLIVLCSGQCFAKEPLQSVTIRLNWIPNVQFAGVLVAKERGWYEEAGIDLTVKGWEEGNVSTDEVAAGKAQIGVAEGDALIKSRAAGNNLKAIATAFQKPAFCLMSKKERGIEKPEQLAGKRIGFSSHESLIMIKLVMAGVGLKDEDITTVQVGWKLDSLINDKIDAREAFMNEEPLAMREKGYEVNIIPAFKYGYDFYSSAYFVTETTLQKHSEIVRKFLDATLRGWKEAFKDPAATVKLVVEKYYPKGSVSQQTESLKVFKFLARVGEGRKYLGWMEEQYWAKGIDILHKFKQIDSKIPAKDVFTLEFLESIYFGKKK
ncbi:ABC transporter substrate-binding protein [Desulfococcaceae bacterium HSG8]|nr:ABC transporter substrate-binding protein [Desulfococcaceae bacterium HSG8]